MNTYSVQKTYKHSFCDEKTVNFLPKKPSTGVACANAHGLRLGAAAHHALGCAHGSPHALGRRGCKGDFCWQTRWGYTAQGGSPVYRFF